MEIVMKRFAVLTLIMLFSCSNQPGYKSAGTVQIDGECRIGQVNYLPYVKSKLDKNEIEMHKGDQRSSQKLKVNIDEFVEDALRKEILTTDVHLTEESELVIEGEINSISIVESGSMTVTASITFNVKNAYERYFQYQAVHEKNYENNTGSYEEYLADVIQMCIVDFLIQAKELETFQPIRQRGKQLN